MSICSRIARALTSSCPPDNCFLAAVLMGLNGLGLPIPVAVAKHLSAEA